MKYIIRVYRIVHLSVLIEFINQVPVCLFLNLIHPVRSVGPGVS